MEELSASTGWMKKVIIGVVGLVVILGIVFAVFGTQSVDGECETEGTETVSPVDIDAESSPF